MKRLLLLLIASILPLCFSDDAWSVSFKHGNIAVSYQGKPLFNSIPENKKKRS